MIIQEVEFFDILERRNRERAKYSVRLAEHGYFLVADLRMCILAGQCCLHTSWLNFSSTLLSLSCAHT